MSAQLNFNQKRNISWKGRTITQITSSIKKNVNTNATSTSIRMLFKANPLKIYRREIASPFDITRCAARTSITIDGLNRPNGSINNSVASTKNGLVTTIDNILPNNTCEEPGTCLKFLSPSENAKRRVRRSANVKRQFDISKNNDTYYTSTNQYLVSRNRTFQQNQYNYIRQGDPTATPGTSLAVANIYSPSGLSHCQKYYFSAACTFQYKWYGAGDIFTVTIPIGYYTIEDLNKVLQTTMVANYHYLILGTSQSRDQNIEYNNSYLYNQTIVFLLNISYNNIYGKVVLQSIFADRIKFLSSKYSIPTNPTSGFPSWSPLYEPFTPQFIIPNNPLLINAIGFTAGSYPLSNALTTNQTFLSAFKPGIQPLYVELYYKPNNPQFAQQGAVSSSSLTSRIKYDSITNATVPMRKAYGSAAANALAYGVPEYGYTVKTRIGYEMKKIPVFSKITGAMTTCPSKHIVGG